MLSILHFVMIKLCVRIPHAFSGGILQWFTNLYSLVWFYTVWEWWKCYFVILKMQPKYPVRFLRSFRGVILRNHGLVVLWWHIWDNLASCNIFGLGFWSGVWCILYSLGQFENYTDWKLPETRMTGPNQTATTTWTWRVEWCSQVCEEIIAGRGAKSSECTAV